MKECTTHHHACDCREAEFKALEDRLKEAEWLIAKVKELELTLEHRTNECNGAQYENTKLKAELKEMDELADFNGKAAYHALAKVKELENTQDLTGCSHCGRVKKENTRLREAINRALTEIPSFGYSKLKEFIRAALEGKDD